MLCDQTETSLLYDYENAVWLLHAVLEADDGPELDINIGGVLDTRLVVNPINDAFGIPTKYLRVSMHLTTTNKVPKFSKDSNN